MRLTEIRRLEKCDALAAFEGAIDLLQSLVHAAARHDRDPAEGRRPALRDVPSLLSVIGRLLDADARKEAHEIDRESAWFAVFETWLDDEAAILRDFEARLLRMASLPSDRKLLVRLASEGLADLPLVFPAKGQVDARRAVVEASRFRLESLIATLLSSEGRPAYALAIAEAHRKKRGDSAILVEALLSCSDSGAAVAAAQRALEDPREVRPARIHALLGEALTRHGSGREVRVHLETAFLRLPSEAAFLALKRKVPDEQWPQVRSRLLGHLQKHQKDPTLLFKLYWNEGLILDADGLVVTQPVDPDVLASAARKLEATDSILAAGWLLVAAHRLADSFPRARWPDVVRWLVVVQELAARSERESEFKRALRTFRFRHAHAPHLLELVARAGL